MGANTSEEARRKEENEAKYHAWKLSRRVEHIPCDVQNWIPLLRELTFATELIHISQPEAEALVAAFRHWGQHARPLTPAEAARIAELQEKVAAAMRAVDASGLEGVFVRLGSRSAKDAATLEGDTERFRAELDKRRADAERDHPGDKLWRGNAEVLAVADATWRALRVTTPEAAMARLQHSERVFEDLLEALEAASRNSGVWQTTIAIRRWEPRLRHDREFRAFVWSGRLTAISQYNHLACFPGLWNERERLAAALTRFWQDSVAPKLSGHLDNYVVDLAVLSGTDGSSCEEIRVVEINPFRDSTGAALFDWSRDGDTILRHPPEPGALPELRVLAAPLKGIDVHMAELVSQLLAEDTKSDAPHEH